MDDNTTQVILAVIGLLGLIATSVFSFLSLRYASAAKTNSAEALTSSQANAATLSHVSEAVNGLTRERVNAEVRIGDAKATAAFAEGRIEEIKAAQAPPPPALPADTP